MRSTRHLIVAAALAVTLLLGLATPAAAAGPFTFQATQGTLGTVLGNIPVVPEQGAPCPPKGTLLELYTEAGGDPLGWELGGGFSTMFQLPTGSGNWYQADFSFFTGIGGTFTPNPAPPTYDVSGMLAIQIDIYGIGVNDCEKDDLRCTVSGLFTVTSGIFVGSLPTPAPGFTFLVSGSTAATGIPLVVAACSPPFAALNGTDATIF